MARIHSVARLGRYQEVAECLASGADPNAISVRGFTPLMQAVQEGHLTTVRLLLEARANPNSIQPDGRTALHLSTRQDEPEIIRLLIAHGADLETMSRGGQTPLLEAAMLCRRKAVAILLESGADPTHRDKKGKTAEEWLAEGGIRGLFRSRFPRLFLDPDQPTEALWADEKMMEAVRKQMAEGLSPEEYAAKHGRFIMIWGYGEYRYRDPEMEAWVRRFSTVLFTPALLAECEERYLAGEDLEHARKERETLDRWQKKRERMANRRPPG